MSSLTIVQSKPEGAVMYGNSLRHGDAHQAGKPYSIPCNGTKYPNVRHSQQYNIPQKGTKHSNVQRFLIGPLKSTSQSHQVLKTHASENSTGLEKCGRSVGSLVSSYGIESSENLDQFLECTTPLIHAQYLPKTSMKEWQTREVGFLPFFTLGDLWESFDEWSAYGAGVPVLMNGSDYAIQYYVPYLSAIQLYIESSKLSIKTRYNRWAQSDQSEVFHQHFSSGDDEGGNMPGCLIFQYFEHAIPYSREPLADKIADLARNFPQLKTLRSIDLLPSSWLSVAWYPIYIIPSGLTLHNRASCFLTFHFLSTALKDGGTIHLGVGGMEIVSRTTVINTGESVKIALRAFGLGSYRPKGATRVSTSTGSYEQWQAHSLFCKADEWLRLLGVEHPDFEFFVSHNFFYHRCRMTENVET